MTVSQYEVSTNEPQPNNLAWRLRLLWAGVKNLFTGRGLTLNGGVSGSVRQEGMSVQMWIKPQGSDTWEHWATSFDGKVAKGYVNGKQV